MADNIENRRILITGASGTIGRALVEYYLSSGDVVCAYDNNEDGLFKLGRSFYPIHGKEKLKLFVGDIRDLQRLQYAFVGVDYVVHAAALKHVELSEYNVLDCIETNINGTKNVIHAAINAGVKKVLFTSSDKAVNPTSTMGATKLIGERIITDANYLVGDKRVKFSSIRFGNVLNSNGSVLTIFRHCYHAGKPFPITHREMTRFFLTISDAIDLVDYALDRMHGGEIFIKSMGAANILSIAQAVAGKADVDIDLIGVKAGEKLYEELVTEPESKRTVYSDDIYLIFPDLSGLDDRLHQAINFDGWAVLGHALTSVETNLDWQMVMKMVNRVQ